MRIVVVFNKWWECDPGLAAMLNNTTAPPSTPWPRKLQVTRPIPEAVIQPSFSITRAQFCYKNFEAELWGVPYLLEGLQPAAQSSSEEKAKRLPKIFEFGKPPELV